MALPGVFDKTGIDSGWFSDESKPEGWFDDNLLTSSGAAPSGITGNLASTDSGADAAALEGVALVSGSVAATESGADSTAISGALLAHGDLSATDGGADTFSAAGVVDSILSAITGVFDAIESGADSFFATNIDQKPAPGGAGGSWVIPRKKRKRENDEAFLLAVLI